MIVKPILNLNLINFYFVNSIFDMKNNNFLIEYIFKSIYEDGDKYPREMPGTYVNLENFKIGNL